MRQKTYDLKNETGMISEKDLKAYYISKQGKENQNSLGYKLKELKENQLLDNSGTSVNTNIMMNSKISQNQNQSIYNKYKTSNVQNNNINNTLDTNSNRNNISNNNSINNTNRKNTSIAQIDEGYEMKKLLDLEKQTHSSKHKEKNKHNMTKMVNNYSNSNLHQNMNNSYNNDIDKNIKKYIDEKTEMIKEFIHEELNNLHVDLIRQFEIQNIQNTKTIQEYLIANSQMAKEIERLKNENQLLKDNSIVK